MKFEALVHTATRNIHRVALHINKVSPTILTGVGVVGLTAAGVIACYETYQKMDDIVNDHKKRMEGIENLYEGYMSGRVPEEKYNEDYYKKDKFLEGLTTCKNVIGLYYKPVILASLSVACIAKGHSIMVKRNIALMAAYDTLDKAFKKYRKNVVAELGEEKDKEFKYNLKEAREAANEKTVPTHPGVRKEKTAADYSQYAKFFDSANPNWSKTPEYNMMFLKAQQNWANDLLVARGHLFLNEVYDALGLPRTQAGAVVGWIYGEGYDNYVDFGLFDGSSEAVRAFVNGDEDTILLDFNVDGVIWDKI